MQAAVSIHIRMITRVSGQPLSSKWWWIGAILKMRRPNSRKLATCRITEVVSMTNSRPRIGNSSAVDELSARAARPVPMASEPVSPMKICAGAALYQRNPAQAPIIAAATIARSRPTLMP